jgi:hypothetical protein
MTRGLILYFPSVIVELGGRGSTVVKVLIGYFDQVAVRYLCRTCFLGKENHKLNFRKYDAEEDIWSKVGKNCRNYNVYSSSKNVRIVTWGRLRSGKMWRIWESIQKHIFFNNVLYTVSTQQYISTVI